MDFEPSRVKVDKEKTSSNSPFPFDKYDLYRRAVQSPENDVVFLKETYRALKGAEAITLREDFCGTFALSTEWIKLNDNHQSVGLDLDPEPIAYGYKNYASTLSEEQKGRLIIQKGNVLESPLPSADMVLAANFSYFCFKQRSVLKKYFENVYHSLKEDGIFILDAFGGSQCQDAIEDVLQKEGFKYYWDQENFDPITGEAQFHIHFRWKGKKHEKVFSYDWRLWSIPELKDLLSEVGFQKIHVYWEGTEEDGSGNGVFTPSEKGESCLSWIAYLAAEKNSF